MLADRVSRTIRELELESPACNNVWTTRRRPHLLLPWNSTVATPLTLYGMPQSCYDAMNEYNQYSDMEILNSAYGTAVIQGVSIALSQVPD